MHAAGWTEPFWPKGFTRPMIPMIIKQRWRYEYVSFIPSMYVVTCWGRTQQSPECLLGSFSDMFLGKIFLRCDSIHILCLDWRTLPSLTGIDSPSAHTSLLSLRGRAIALFDLWNTSSMLFLSQTHNKGLFECTSTNLEGLDVGL